LSSCSRNRSCAPSARRPTYRFSEDLDFTIRDEAHLDEGFLKRVFAEIGAWIYEQTGIEVPADQQEFEILRNPRQSLLSGQGQL
jgi:predicted nucleotidyltransferase component of viral defense system